MVKKKARGTVKPDIFEKSNTSIVSVKRQNENIRRSRVGGVVIVTFRVAVLLHGCIVPGLPINNMIVLNVGVPTPSRNVGG